MLLLTLFAALLGAASLVAQGSCYQIPTTSLTSGNTIPFGNATASNTKYQIMMLNTDLTNPGNICEVEFMPSGTGVRHFDSIRIRLGYFALSGTTLGTTFSANLMNPKTVLDARNYDWPHTQNQWTPIGLQSSFAYIPQVGHLVIEITVTGAYIGTRTGGTGFRVNTGRQRLYSRAWTTEPTTGTLATGSGLAVEVCYQTAMADVYGLGCTGSNTTIPALVFTGTPKLSSSFSVDVSGGLPNANMFLVLGLQRLQTPLLLPGATSCHAYTSLDIVLLQKLSSTGTFSQKFAVPKSLPDCLKVYTQAFPWDSGANAFGASATNYGRLRVGQ
jgi:hypothetical protein